MVTITGPRQIEIDLRARSPGDYIRVLTGLSPGAARVYASGISHTSAALAIDDRASTLDGQRVLTDVLGNDRGLTDTPISLELLSVPANSRAFVRSEFVQGDNQVAFYPAPGFYGEQSLIYRITHADGNAARGTVVIDVLCADCCETPNNTLSWIPNPGNRDGYRVFFGCTPTTADNPITDVTINSVTFNAGTNLGLRADDRACFRLKAYIGQGESDFSDAVCATLLGPRRPEPRLRRSLPGQKPENPSTSIFTNKYLPQLSLYDDGLH